MATARFDLTALAAETRAAISALIDDAVAAERERIRQLAIELDATYVSCPCDPARGIGDPSHGPEKFADLLDGAT